MLAMIGRWPVLVTVPLGAEDADGDGCLTDEAVERIFAAGRSAYFDLCTTVDPSAIEIRSTSIRARTASVCDAVTVSVSVVGELFPDRFTMSARIRPAETDGIAADVSCSASPGGNVTTAMRVEFIALAHSARHMN